MGHQNNCKICGKDIEKFGIYRESMKFYGFKACYFCDKTEFERTHYFKIGKYSSQGSYDFMLKEQKETVWLEKLVSQIQQEIRKQKSLNL